MPAIRPASEYSCGEANSFFEEYAATPVYVGRVCIVKKVGLGRVLSIKTSCCLSSFSFSASAARYSGLSKTSVAVALVATAPASHSQFSAPPVWYSMTRVSKKLRSFFRSIISLIHGKGFSSCSNSASKPICCARRFAMKRR